MTTFSFTECDLLLFFDFDDGFNSSVCNIDFEVEVEVEGTFDLQDGILNGILNVSDAEIKLKVSLCTILIQVSIFAMFQS